MTGRSALIVEGVPLCREHGMEWAQQEANDAAHDRVRRVMGAIDAVAEQEIGGDWSAHLRKMALAAIEAM